MSPRKQGEGNFVSYLSDVPPSDTLKYACPYNICFVAHNNFYFSLYLYILYLCALIYKSEFIFHFVVRIWVLASCDKINSFFFILEITFKPLSFTQVIETPLILK